jgi:hypothetical protein
VGLPEEVDEADYVVIYRDDIVGIEADDDEDVILDILEVDLVDIDVDEIDNDDIVIDEVDDDVNEYLY